MIKNADWIKNDIPLEHHCPVFRKSFSVNGDIKKCTLSITAMGVYSAQINNERISDIVLAPGWTVFEKRLQYQTYDITSLIGENNTLKVTVGTGWYRGRLPGPVEKNKYKYKEPAELICEITIYYMDGRKESIYSDKTWEYAKSKILLSDIYDGETYDADYNDTDYKSVAVDKIAPKSNLVLQRNSFVKEHERVKPMRCFVTPKGEKVIDFGQEITGYTEFTVTAKKGDRIRISHGEVLDKHGNFYNANYRSAVAEINYICKDGKQTYKPHLTFFGFRYIRLDEFPFEVNLNDFTAIAVHTEMERTGDITCSNEKVNQLFSNIIWGQKGNFLDIPTDCPQRDERLGWTGDAQVFIRTASYNFDVENFFEKWLADLVCDQSDEGEIPSFCPNVLYHKKGYKEWCSASAWGDAACICPWQLYLTYGNRKILARQFESMKNWVRFSFNRSKDEKTLNELGGRYGDWLALDAEDGAYKGSTNYGFIAFAFLACSAEITVKAGKILGADVSEFEKIYSETIREFRTRYSVCNTQTECALAVYFNLLPNKQEIGDCLNDMVVKNGNHLTTGFVGTPYLLHALSITGHNDTAYSLLLQEEYPSWLYSVNQGATTVWEHWDSKNDKGEFWSTDMNSFNHYAYGAVADWIYSVAAGIKPVEDCAGFEKVIISPKPDKRLKYLKASFKSRQGEIVSFWKYTADGTIRYEITTPSPATVIIGNKEYSVDKGSYIFYSNPE